MLLEYATPIPSDGPRRPLISALATLCLTAGIALCGIGIAIAAVELRHPAPAHFVVIIFGAVFCFFGLRLNRHLKRRWLRGVYIPNIYLPTVCLLRTAFASGLPFDSPQYTAICLFLDHEGCPPRDIVHTLVFSFDIEYVDAINALESMEEDTSPTQTIAQMEQLLEPHGLQTWRNQRQEDRASSCE
jgi:hypothetical protein